MDNEPHFEGEVMKIPQGAGITRTSLQQSRPAFGLMLSVLFFILVVILGGLVYWYRTTLETPVVLPPALRPTAEENNEPESTTAEALSDTLMVVSTSDEIDAIEADVKSTNLVSIEADLAAIEGELSTIDSIPSEPTPQP